VRENEPDEEVFVLVTGKCPEYLIHGWMYGKEAKKKEWLADYGGYNAPAYFVPGESLKDMAALI